MCPRAPPVASPAHTSLRASTTVRAERALSWPLLLLLLLRASAPHPLGPPCPRLPPRRRQRCAPFLRLAARRLLMHKRTHQHLYSWRRTAGEAQRPARLALTAILCSCPPCSLQHAFFPAGSQPHGGLVLLPVCSATELPPRACLGTCGTVTLRLGCAESPATASPAEVRSAPTCCLPRRSPYTAPLHC